MAKIIGCAVVGSLGGPVSGEFEFGRPRSEGREDFAGRLCGLRFFVRRLRKAVGIVEIFGGRVRE